MTPAPSGAAAGTCAAALSTEPDLDAAVAEVADAVDGQLGGPPDLVVAFATHHHGGEQIGRAHV